MPDAYASTSEPGVFKDLHSGQTFIFHDKRSYAVAQDADTRDWRLTTPGNPRARGSALQRNALGAWMLQTDSTRPRSAGRAAASVGSRATAVEDVAPPRWRRLAGTGSTASPAPTVRPPASAPSRPRQALPEPTLSDRIANHLLRNPGARHDDLPSRYGATAEQVEKIASDVQSAVRGWHDLQNTGLQVRLSVIVRPFTNGEKAYLRKWGGRLPVDTFAAIMHKPKDMIENYLHRTNCRTSSSLPEPSRAALLDLAHVGWRNLIRRELASGTRPSGVFFTPEAEAFAARWSGALSVHSIGLLMSLPKETIAAHMRAFDGAVPAQHAAASAQPGPSGYQPR
ncbi:DUF6543 domain-containing protein [Paraburkholderia sp. SOS3]|uniref:DUF6543 domain-containing protein n=1 Tax=Paraburkholderia sp. SOS3 TaxID=1926494 RepID=UPI00094766E7|nr:DUF6543 domain-containing protein [Paraburkholderia sp. SOS3]APR39666.1 hypothetical protein BTO02_31150 [Paraburkholderia sp. SOS3]